MVKRKTKIIATIGPATESSEMLRKLEDRGVDFVRINLSHTPFHQIEEKIDNIRRSIKTEIILDTESSQTRTGYIGKGVIALESSKEIRIHKRMVECDVNNVYIRPPGYLDKLEIGDLISVDFENVLLSVKDVSSLKGEDGYITCKVVIGGVFGSNKAVALIDKDVKLSPLSAKDIEAIRIAKTKGIRYFTLSFVDSKEDVWEFKKLYPEAVVYSKVENRSSLENIEGIINLSDGILIDRGDLSKEIPLERVAIVQKIIIRKCNEKKKPVFVATNILESMNHSLKPTKSELNDVINIIIDGVSGLALTKETAIGKYPIETVNMLHKLCLHTESTIEPKGPNGNINGFRMLDDVNYLTGGNFSKFLVEPHGGTLINRQMKTPPSQHYLDSLPKLSVGIEVINEVEQIAIGTFSPLTGFMNREDIESVLNNMRLSNGLIWPVPVILQLREDEVAHLEVGQRVLLLYSRDRLGYAILNVEEIFRFDREEYVHKLYGTHDVKHPGVAAIMNGGDFTVGGEIDLIRRTENPNKHYEITPLQARKVFESKGWIKVIAFHTRNVIHRSHEHIQLEGLKMANCDGLFVHPVLGKKKKGDFKNELIIQSYQIMMDRFYPKEKVIFGTFATFPRYAGPREAILTALCRKNFGCSHFIVGRDHTGVGDFYGPNDSHDIFNKFPDLGIEPVKFDKVVYCEKCGEHISVGKYSRKTGCRHGEDHHLDISGTKARAMFSNGEMPPGWFIRPEIAEMIYETWKQKRGIFVQ